MGKRASFHSFCDLEHPEKSYIKAKAIKSPFKSFLKLTNKRLGTSNHGNVESRDDVSGLNNPNTNAEPKPSSHLEQITKEVISDNNHQTRSRTNKLKYLTIYIKQDSPAKTQISNAKVSS